MATITVEAASAATAEAARTLSGGIVDFNHRCVPDLEPIEAEVRFLVFARDDAGALVGGLRASCYWNTLHVELLWLDDAARGGGLGRALMAHAEARAIACGVEIGLVETTSWQARPFYEKCGYVLLSTIDGRPRGHASYTLSKRLARA